MSARRSLLGAVLSWLLVTAAVTGLHAQAGARAPAAGDADARIWSGVYSSAQATRGKAVYEAYCTRCHGLDMVGGRLDAAGGPALAGRVFWLDWEGSTLASLFSKVSKTMPLDSPASLRTDDYADVVAYILSGNTFPAGAAEIPSSAAGLDQVRIVRKAGDVAAEVPNFSLVQVVGCLTGAPDRGWTLTAASAPRVTRDESSSADATRAATAQALGSGRFQLLSLTPFQPQQHVGRKVELRGLLDRSAGGERLDVLALTSLQACDR